MSRTGCGLAQLVGDINRLPDRHQHRRVGCADLADRSMAGVDADGDFHPLVELPAEPVVEVGDHALDRPRGAQRALRGIVAALVTEQRADAVEFHGA